MAQTTEQRIAEIANSFGQGIQNYQAGKQANEARALQAEATRRQQALQGMEAQAKLTEMTGKQVPLEMAMNYLGGTPPTQEQFEKLSISHKLKRDQEALELDKRLKESTINKNNRYKSSSATRPTLEQKLVEDEMRDTAKKTRDAKISDFEFSDPKIIPSSKDAEEIKVANAANKTFQSAGARALEKVSKFGRGDAIFSPNSYKALEQDISEMRVQAKELARLGALTGPDLGLVDSALGSLDRSTLTLLGPEKAMARVKSALSTANEKLMNAAMARGYRPIGQSPSNIANSTQGSAGVVNNAGAAAQPAGSPWKKYGGK